MYCSKCGKEIADEAVICTNCGCVVENANIKAATPSPVKATTEKSPKVSLILGIIGIVTAWLIAIIGHITSIIGIIFGIKEYKETGKMTGLVLSLIGEVCSIFSSIIGAVAMSGMF